MGKGTVGPKVPTTPSARLVARVGPGSAVELSTLARRAPLALLVVAFLVALGAAIATLAAS